MTENNALDIELHVTRAGNALAGFAPGARLALRLAILPLLLIVVLGAACNQQTSPTPIAQPQCSSRDGQGGVTVCIDGSGNVVSITLPPAMPTPTSTPGLPDCNKRTTPPAYQDNVVAAWRSIAFPETTAKGHIAGLIAALKASGFEATSGGLLSGDELAVKTKGGPFSETYDVCAGEYATKCTPQVLYVATCSPASF